MVIDDLPEARTGASFSMNLSATSLREKILQSISNTAKPFVTAINTHKKTDWNEDGLTQIFIAQNTVQLQKLSAPLMVGAQYRDLYHKSKGIPDIYYSLLEEGKDHEPAFLMEAKRLPTPTTARKKEYVIGLTPSGNPNGGIERFKLGKHGVGQTRCGMLAFVESEEYQDWLGKVNSWIIELFPIWSSDELLVLQETSSNYNHYKSIADRGTSKVQLDHFWIKI